jgi:hypothetical protein
MNTDITSLMPGFTGECTQLHTLMADVCCVLAFAGLTLVTVQAMRERATQSILNQLVRIAICTLLLGSLGSWGNVIADGVNGVVSQLGLGTISGGVYNAYTKAIAAKFGSDSAVANSPPITAPAGQGVLAGTPSQSANGILLTHYANPGDTTPDQNSAQGIGAFPFSSAPGSLVNMQSAALTTLAAQQMGLQPGQNFSITSGGTTYNLVYADHAPESDARVDIYDSQGTLPADFSAQATSYEVGGMTTPVTAGGNYPTSNGLFSKIGDSANMAILYPLTHMLSLAAAGFMWLMQQVQAILFYAEWSVSPIFIGLMAIRPLAGIATKFFLSFVALCLWGLAWCVCDELTTALIQFAINPTNNPLVTAASPLTAIGLWIALASWVIGSTICAPMMVTGALMMGSSGLSAVFGATVGVAASQVIAPAAAAGAIGAAGGNVASAPVSAVSAARMASMPSTVSKRPPRGES